MKKILFIVLLGLLFLCVGCGKKATVRPMSITAENIYNVESDKYLVYFEKEDCSQCEKALPLIIDYLTETSSKKNGLKIYSVLLEFTDENGEKVKLPISRAIENGNTGQGPDGNFYVDGVSNWVALYIAATPSLIEVSSVNGTKQSKLVAVGTSEIENYLNVLRNEK